MLIGELKTIVMKRAVVRHYAFNRVRLEIMQYHLIGWLYD